MFDSRIVSGISIFVSVAQTRNYLASSKLVGMSKSGISRSISRLETRLGFRLLERSAKGVKLTSEGRIFYEKVAPLLEQLGDFAARSPSQLERIRGRLRICCESAFATGLLIPRLPELSLRHPGLQIDLVLTSSVKDLITDGYDAAIRFGEPSLTDIEKRILFHTRVLTCASRAYVERYGTPKRLEDFDGRFPCVRHVNDITGRPYDWVCVNEGGETIVHDPECAITLSDSPGIIAALVNASESFAFWISWSRICWPAVRSSKCSQNGIIGAGLLTSTGEPVRRCLRASMPSFAFSRKQPTRTGTAPRRNRLHNDEAPRRPASRCLNDLCV